MEIRFERKRVSAFVSLLHSQDFSCLLLCSQADHARRKKNKHQANLKKQQKSKRQRQLIMFYKQMAVDLRNGIKRDTTSMDYLPHVIPYNMRAKKQPDAVATITTS
jgi:hypothetical protein